MISNPCHPWYPLSIVQTIGRGIIGTVQIKRMLCAESFRTFPIPWTNTVTTTFCGFWRRRRQLHMRHLTHHFMHEISKRSFKTRRPRLLSAVQSLCSVGIIRQGIIPATVTGEPGQTLTDISMLLIQSPTVVGCFLVIFTVHVVRSDGSLTSTRYPVFHDC